MEYKKLRGTEKQIKWANKVREEVLSVLLPAIEKLESTEDMTKSEKRVRELKLIKSELESVEAKFWLDKFTEWGKNNINGKIIRYLNEDDKGFVGRKILKYRN